MKKPTKPLTDAFVRSASHGEKPCADYFDIGTPGLCLRVTKGKKSWGFVFTPPGGTARTRMSLGTYDATGLEEARERARAARKLLEAGTDPRHTSPPPVARMTIAALVDDRVRTYLRADSKNFKWTCMEIERCYDHDVIPIVGNVPMEDFTVSHLKMVTRPIMERGANTQANRVHQAVVALLNFAVQEHGLKYNPLACCKPPSTENVKERWLSLPEIKALWTGADRAMARSELVPDILRLILATGQRPGEECAAIERHEIDLQKRLWTIPKEKAKNKREHVVPLNGLALDILARRMRETNGAFLFPNKEGDGPIRNYVISTCVARAVTPDDGLPLGRLGIAKFTPHDLRRTVATQMSMDDNGLQIPELYISHILNHRSATKGTITGRVYNQNPYLNEKREALDKWGAFLAQLVGVETGLRVAA